MMNFEFERLARAPAQVSPLASRSPDRGFDYLLSTRAGHGDHLKRADTAIIHDSRLEPAERSPSVAHATDASLRRRR